MRSPFQDVLHKLGEVSFQVLGRTSPNPPVAAVATDLDFRILAFAGTQKTGENHAERELYEKLFLQGHTEDSLKNNHHLFVTLEPCTHHGKTPPCSDLVFKYRPKKVWIGHRDPNPLIDSNDFRIYREVGIDVEINSEIANLSLPFLAGFFERISRKKPRIIVKSAVTSNGFYAPIDSQQTRISSPESDLISQILRAKVDAICVGPRTLEVDSPSLDFRMSDSNRIEKESKTPTVGKDFFRESLVRGFSKEAEEFHRLHILNYQPWRFFCLPKDSEPSPKFLEKQRELNQKYGKRLSIFFQIGSKHAKKNWSSLCEEVSEFPIREYGQNDGAEFLSDLADMGINTLVLEVGSFLLHFLEQHLTEMDEILQIRNPNLEWKSGKVFTLFDKDPKQVYQVGSDLWAWKSAKP